MALIVEDGTGRADANSYASREYCTEFHAGHLYAEAWTGATEPKQEAALRMATRICDAALRADGYRSVEGQALEFPRVGAHVEGYEDPHRSPLMMSSTYFPHDEVPKPLKDAVCDMARELLKRDRTADPESAGVAKLNLGQGAVSIDFDPATAPDVLSRFASSMLSKVGHVRGGGLMVPVRRVQ